MIVPYSWQSHVVCVRMYGAKTTYQKYKSANKIKFVMCNDVSM